MKIAVFGLGYVGVVSAACLARDGHTVIGVDAQEGKVVLINRGDSPIVEPGLPELLRDALSQGRLRATTDVAEAVQESEIAFVCVGTPGHSNGSLNLGHVRRVCEQIGLELRTRQGYFVVAVRSTMLPGSIESVVLPALEQASGKKVSEDFGVCLIPEFLREGTAVKDFDHPPKTIVGATCERTCEVVRPLFAGLDAPYVTCDYRTAEMVKYVDNSWHALKVAFANEIGRLCKPMGIDSRELMSIFCQDRKLNISPAYLRPGFAFGGSCLPKDLRAVVYQARTFDVETPVLSAVLASNSSHIEYGLDMILSRDLPRIGLLGLSFKEGTDDLRESPIVVLAERLIGKGHQLRILDRNVRLATLVGANRDFLLNRIPHISRHLVDDPKVLFDESDVIVIATAESEFLDLVRQFGRDKQIVDLVGTSDRSGPLSILGLRDYHGIAW